MRKNNRAIPALLCLLMWVNILHPTVALALTTGPSAPEVGGFTPIGNTDHVNLFTGDFSYNIPLLDVEGYPLNLAYSAGVTMDQEASWVGLGWSLNPGVVERHLRGIPDDFAGDVSRRDISLRDNITVGVNAGIGFELFGVDPNQFGANLTLSVSPSYNNYDGVSFGLGANLGLRSAQNSGSTFTAGLGMNASSNGGLRLQPEVGVESKWMAADQQQIGGGLNFGLGMDSRQGITNTSFGLTTKASGYLNVSRSFGSSYDIGQPTYSPQIPVAMKSLNLSARFTMGGAAGGTHPNWFVGGSYAQQVVRNKTIEMPCYGYMHLGTGQYQDRALLDINREKDGAFSQDKHALPIASLTNDVFAVSGQNIGGSFRAFRDEVGYVFDPSNVSTGFGVGAAVELGATAGLHLGVDVNVNGSETKTGVWNDGNEAASAMGYKTSRANALDEHVFFRDASEAVVEQDPALYSSYGGDKAAKFTMISSGAYNMKLKNELHVPSASNVIPSMSQRSKRDARGQVLTFMSHREVNAGLGLEPAVDRTGTPLEGQIRDHHMSEVTVLSTDGARNVYGLPAYNIVQRDVTFSVPAVDENDELVGYNAATDATVNNLNGKDRYFSSATTPPYAYAFYLTAALSHDYSDVDGVAGPSAGDLGHYTRFTYVQSDMDYEWRTPVGDNEARAEEGLGAVDHDDKASYVYGRKELWNVQTVESRNLVAYFTTEARLDGLGVNEQGVEQSADVQERLVSIDLFTRADYEVWATGGWVLLDKPQAIKTVHFEYSYELCQQTPNSDEANKGKLTLTSVYFTYGRSNRGVTSPYVFHYDGENPDYALGGSDRWGNYKPHATSELRNHEFPYAEQDRATADLNASAWNLTSIELPSGGVIEVDYESDDYAYVQNRRAERMFIVENIEIVSQLTTQPTSFSPPPDAQVNVDGIIGGTEEIRVSVRIPSDWTADQRTAWLASVPGDFYFRFKTALDFTTVPLSAEDGFDYVSGYARCSSSGLVYSGTPDYAWFVVSSVDFDEEPPTDQRTPFFRSTLEHARRFYPSEVFQPDGASLGMQDPVDAIIAMASSIESFLTGWTEYLVGPNRTALENLPSGYLGKVTMEESWVRLPEPTGYKLGGGHRVKEIRFKDQWDDMTGEPDRQYGQQYTYTVIEPGQDVAPGSEVSISSGVAAWEPNSGADENCWRWPAYGSTTTAVFPKDERFYQEEPFGESMFPSASVGYSKVTVQDLYPPDFETSNQRTGSVVNEFYTAKDYPTITSKTGIDVHRRRSNYDLLSILGIKANDHNHVSQGFVVETNDMHGKPKRTTVYAEPLAGVETQPVSWVAYHYADEVYGAGRRLVNEANTIDPDGTVATATIGRNYEFYGDMRKFNSKSLSGGFALNTEMIIPPATIPIILFNFSSESKIHKSGVLVKKIERFGLLNRVEKMENGSIVNVENVAYDALTGQVLLTKTINDFEDPVYSMTFPAYWHYDGMGPAFKNVAASITGLVFTNGTSGAITNAHDIFIEGDEVSLTASNGGLLGRAWVDDVQAGSIHLIDAIGDPVSGTFTIKVLRSGRRNMQMVPMTTLALLSDPLQGLSSNIFRNILNAQVVEMKDNWRTQCTCVESGDMTSANPFRMNVRGVWRLNKEHAWLTARTRSHYNNNTDIRKDGVYATFDPFYEVNNGHWGRDSSGWTMVREVTEYGALGQELENRDALGLFSSASFGHNGTLPKTVARNAKYNEVGFEGFEESFPSECTDQHFRFEPDPANVVSDEAHTGRRCLRVEEGAPLEMITGIGTCEPEACTLESTIGGTEGTRTLTVAQGSPPYTITPVTIVGAPTVSLSTTGISVTGAGYVLQVTVTDSEGCANVITVTP